MVVIVVIVVVVIVVVEAIPAVFVPIVNKDCFEFEFAGAEGVPEGNRPRKVKFFTRCKQLILCHFELRTSSPIFFKVSLPVRPRFGPHLAFGFWSISNMVSPLVSGP